MFPCFAGTLTDNICWLISNPFLEIQSRWCTVYCSDLSVLHVCQSNRQDYVSYSEANAGSIASKGYMKLKDGSNHGSSIQSQLTYR